MEIAEWNFHFAERWKSAGYSNQEAMFKSVDKVLRVTRFSDAVADGVEASLNVGSFAPLRGWRFSGGPVAVPNLCFRENLQPARYNLRVHAFQLPDSRYGSNFDADGVTFAECLPVDDILNVGIKLVDGGLVRNLSFSVNRSC